MLSMWKRRLLIHRQTRKERGFQQELRSWDEMQSVGREFGSPDFERLMAEDSRDDSGVFDPALKLLFPGKREKVAQPTRVLNRVHAAFHRSSG